MTIHRLPATTLIVMHLIWVVNLYQLLEAGYMSKKNLHGAFSILGASREVATMIQNIVYITIMQSNLMK